MWLLQYFSDEVPKLTTSEYENVLAVLLKIRVVGGTRLCHVPHSIGYEGGVPSLWVGL